MSFVPLSRILHYFALAAAVLTGVANAYAQAPAKPGIKERGGASYYADKFNGRPTASGEKFSNNEMTCAHRTLPFGTLLKVTDLNNGRTVVVRVNDRGPFKKGRIVDLSKKAAEALGIVQQGVGVVEIETIAAGTTVPEPDKVPDVKEEQKEKPLYEDAKFQMGKSYSVWATERKTFGYGIQIGSFTSFESARNVGKAILNEGFEAVYIQCGIMNDLKVFRVLVNLYADKKDAGEDIKKLKKLGFEGFVKQHFNN